VTFAGQPQETRRRLAALKEQAERRFADARAASDAMATMTAGATSPGGEVRVTVSSAGALTGLELAEDVTRWRAADIAANVLECVRRAQASLADQARAIMADTMGENPMTDVGVDQLRRAFPPAGPPERTAPGPTEVNLDFMEDR
jgi:hypothetical protein